MAVLEKIRDFEQLMAPERRTSLASARERLERATFVLAVVGEFSSGKSFLLNALLGKYRFETVAGREQIVGLLATDINPSTATITELEYAPDSQAYAYHQDGRVERVPLDRLSQFVAIASDEKDAPTRVLVKVDSPFLRRGFTVADTPGLASINPAHRRATLQFLPGADAVLYLIDTQQPFTEGDASFLGIIRRHLDTIFIVQTKIDLWQQQSQVGKPAWEAARDRIMQLAAIHAPSTYVYALSARQYAEGMLRNNQRLVERSRFVQFLSALDASLVRNTGRARLRRVRDAVKATALEEAARLQLDREMLALDVQALQARRAQTEPQIAELTAFVRSLQESTREASQRLASTFEQRADSLADEARHALSHAFDTSDIARLRDRPRLHMIVDRTLGEAVQVFADDVASAVFAEYERARVAAQERLGLRFSFANAAAAAFGHEGTSSVWSENPSRALSATIVLEAIGGPAIALVHDIATRFAAAPPGAYMRRELTADLRAEIWPGLHEQIAAFTRAVVARIALVDAVFQKALEEALDQARDAALGSIDRAIALRERSGNPGEAAGAMQRRIAEIDALLHSIDETIDRFLERGEEIPAADAGAEMVRRSHVDAEFDREAYRLGLRPQRWRVAILGALRRGKSSLINAFAGRRVLGDEIAGAIAYPVHVRYGEQEGAFALQPDGVWREVEIESALEEAWRNPVLILTPWNLPRELVLVHAPAFDAGDTTLEDVCMVAAREASEVLCLFSRQLSDRELSLYARVADLGKPMMFVHTLADNETPSERKHVVELAQQYLRERAIPSQRTFTVSTLEYAQAKREQRAPAGWNELDALISTISAHAEEHMARLERLERAAAPAVPAVPEQAPVEKRRGLLSRLFSR